MSMINIQLNKRTINKKEELNKKLKEIYNRDSSKNNDDIIAEALNDKYYQNKLTNARNPIQMKINYKKNLKEKLNEYRSQNEPEFRKLELSKTDKKYNIINNNKWSEKFNSFREIRLNYKFLQDLYSIYNSFQENLENIMKSEDEMKPTYFISTYEGDEVIETNEKLEEEGYNLWTDSCAGDRELRWPLRILLQQKHNGFIVLYKIFNNKYYNINEVMITDITAEVKKNNRYTGSKFNQACKTLIDSKNLDNICGRKDFFAKKSEIIDTYVFTKEAYDKSDLRPVLIIKVTWTD